MPELAEVEVVRRNLERWGLGRAAREVRVVDDQLVDPMDVRCLTQTLESELVSVRRRGKYLIARFGNERILVFHFRMTGKIICSDVEQPDYARLSWRVEPAGWLVFKDQRRLGTLRLLTPGAFQAFEPLQRMGPEPSDVGVQDIRGACTGRRLLKTALLDQSIVAGVGNIAVSELYWRLELAPDITCGTLTQRQWEALVDEMPRYFEALIEASMADEIAYVQEGDGAGVFDVYGRRDEPCRRCGATIESCRVGGRVSYYCPACQPTT